MTDHRTSSTGGEPTAATPPPYGTPDHGTPDHGTPPYGTPESVAPPAPPQPPTPDSRIPDPLPASGTNRGPLLAGVVVALLMLGAVALTVTLRGRGGIDAQSPDPGPGSVTGVAAPAAAPTRVDLLDLRTGDCVLYRGGPEVLEDIEAVPCTQQHDAEMSGTVTLPETPWPGEEALNRKSDDACRSVFESYVGISFDDSHLDYTYITPQKEGWESGDRVVICLVTTTDGTVATPMAGSRA